MGSVCCPLSAWKQHCFAATSKKQISNMISLRIPLLALGLAVAVCAYPAEYDTPVQQVVLEADCILRPSNGSTAGGRVRLLQTQPGSAVQVSGHVTGLSPGLHGFHLHQKGVLGNDCKDTGGHFNPTNVHHGAPTDPAQHAGDFGNINASAEQGEAQVLFETTQVSLEAGAENVATGRAFVVHALQDDLGRGNTDESRKTGSAGARIACCVVEPVRSA